MNYFRLNLALVLIVIGLFSLAINIGILDSDAILKLFSFWPVLLITWGIGIIAEITRLRWLHLVTIFLLLGIAGWIFVSHLEIRERDKHTVFHSIPQFPA